jgi:hypothetical protein
MTYIGNFPSTKEFSMKPNRFLLAAILGLALTFTFSCSDDDGGKTGACRWIETHKGKTYDMCTENDEWTKKDCEYDYDDATDGKYYGSCPSGYTLKCKGKKSTYYLYDNTFQNCDEFLDWEYN